MAMFVNASPSDNNGLPQEMPLDEFVKSASSTEIKDLLETVRTETFSACHKFMPGPHALRMIADETSNPKI
jgi:hypothetical protein